MKMNIEIRDRFEVLLRSARESWILGSVGTHALNSP